MKEYRKCVLETEQEGDSKEEKRLEEEDWGPMVKFSLNLELKDTILQFVGGVESKHKPQ
jgi:hypothetical protein